MSTFCIGGLAPSRLRRTRMGGPRAERSAPAPRPWSALTIRDRVFGSRFAPIVAEKWVRPPRRTSVGRFLKAVPW